MTETVAVPVWVLGIILLLALWVVAERLLVPGVRWFFRRRVNRVIEEFNQRLRLKLPTFSLTKRRVLVERLTYDPRLMAAVAAYCERTGTPRQVAMEQVERYAREIIPAFNAYVYFRIGRWIATRIVRRLYRVRLAYDRDYALDRVDPNTSIVFVINHRSNMDYVLLAYVAQRQAALSFAVGEWARVWPVTSLIRALGGYFVRRNSGSELYRRVLERYVQMAVQGGVVQAVFPEGGLSRDGRFREPKVGLLDYMLRDFDPQGQRDILFVPVGVNYDRVVEDRNLLRQAHGHRAERKSTLYAIHASLAFVWRSARRRLRGEWHRMGYAAAAFGSPQSAREWCRQQGIDFRTLAREERLVATRAFADQLMGRIGDAMPALPVSMVCWILLTDPVRYWSRAGLEAAYADAVIQLRRRERPAFVPRRDPTYAVEAGLRMLRLRQMVLSGENGYRVNPEQRELLDYYAAGVRHLLEPGRYRVPEDPPMEPITGRKGQPT